MISSRRHPRLSTPMTIVAEAEQVHLIAGEDTRYTLTVGGFAGTFAALLRRCDGSQRDGDLLEQIPPDSRTAASNLIERLYAERVLIDGGPEDLRPDRSLEFHIHAEGDGPLLSRLDDRARLCSHFKCAWPGRSSLRGSPGNRRVNASGASDDGAPPPPIPGEGIAIPPSEILPGDLETAKTELSALPVLCQSHLDYHAAYEFNSRCREGQSPWLWVSTGAVDRAYVSPIFLPDAGPCLACLLRTFQRLSPAPILYDVLFEHGKQGGTFQAATIPERALAVVEQLVRWKVEQFHQDRPVLPVFRLHVLEIATMEVSVHRVLRDPTCPACSNAIMG